MAGKQQERVNVEGHELTLTNLGKIIYPETGTTKAEVLEYYAAVAPFLIPAAANRPVTRKRWVNGVGTAEHPGQVFFQKNLEDSAPKWIPRAAIQHSDHSNVYPLVNNLATLTWMAQIASLEIHVPQWQVDAAGKPLRPDRFVLDLDPGPGAGLPECVEVAKLARSILQDMSMDPVPVTSGSKGIHLYTGLDGTLKSEQVAAFAHELARALESDHPDLVVSDMKKSLRKGKVLVDWSQNSGNKTTIVPYSLRGRAFPTVAAPRTWRELASASLEHLDFLSVMKRVKTGKDHFAPISERHLPPHGEDEKDDGGAAPGSTGTGSSGTGSSGTVNTGTGSSGSPRERVVTVENRLAKYVGMRDPDKTPEPFPSSSAVSSGAAGRSSSDQPKPGEPPPPGGIFVIQEHHARRYHLDFRLEHEGVLVSWALPRGVPETTDRNNLAVHTEDHPMDYATFAGVIPKGEYGAGTVSIWDRGEYTCEKWRDGKEVIATLTGEPGGGLGGTRRFALINTGQNWLIHQMKEQPGGRHGGPSPGKAAPKPEPTQPTPSTPQPMPNYTPMLATSGTTAELSGDDWLFELKWDGIRAIITGTEGKIRLMSRNGNDLTATYPEVTDRGSWPEGNFVADGEIVALGKGSRPDFGRLQLRMNLVKTADIERARASVPVQLMLFDLLYDDGTDLSGLPFRERRERLSGFAGRLRKDSPVHLSAVLDHDVEDLMTSAAELGLEGVMAKKADSRYVIGRRSRSWIKLKLEQSQEVVVGGWRPGAGARSGTFGALLLGIPDGGKLHYVGRVGSGFKDWQLRDIMEHLEPRVVGESPFADIPREDAAGATWVSPELVAEVTFGEWTGPGRLRHPVWRGWRPDKSPDDVSQPN